MDVDWLAEYNQTLREIGSIIKKNNMRISMHPDQFVLINAKDDNIVKKSIADLTWHAQLLDALGVDTTAKIQIHVGGIYGDKKSAIHRFIQSYEQLPKKIKLRLAIENDDVSYALKDCLEIHARCGIPIIFDVFHHACLNNGEPLNDALRAARQTWSTDDGPLMIDYSSQQPGARKGNHAATIDIKDWKTTFPSLDQADDVMLEIKDKEKSALMALNALKNHYK